MDQNTRERLLSVSRRSFLKLATGVLTTIPTVAGAFFLPHEVALAASDESFAETDGGSLANAAAGATIHVVSPTEIGIYVFERDYGCVPRVNAHEPLARVCARGLLRSRAWVRAAPRPRGLGASMVSTTTGASKRTPALCTETP